LAQAPFLGSTDPLLDLPTFYFHPHLSNFNMCATHWLFALHLLANLTPFVASDAAVAEDMGKPALISDMSAPAAPPDSAQARIALRQHREVAALNRYTFRGNVLQGSGDTVDHWIVMFCSGWHEKCQGLLPSYEILGVQWENKLNNGLMSSGVRFAKVDCATEKALCVSLDIDDYPSVVHYRNNQRVASWHGGAPGLVRFVKQELEGPRRRPKQQAAQAKRLSSCDALSPYAPPSISAADKPGEIGHHWCSFRSLCFALVLLAVAQYMWGLLRGSVFRGRNGKGTGCEHRPATIQQQHAVSSSPLQACLPHEWAAERASIVL